MEKGVGQGKVNLLGEDSSVDGVWWKFALLPVLINGPRNWRAKVEKKIFSEQRRK